MPVKPPISATMLVSVARSSIDMASTAGPANSNTTPMASPPRMSSDRSSSCTMSRATTPGRSLPVHSTRTTSGIRHRTRPVTQLLAMSVAPAPKASAPSAPECGVCESVPITTSPGSA